jgi:hypothetical protein
MEVYPNNTAAKYMTILPNVIDLNGDWEVALYEIAFPAHFENVMENSHWMKFDDERVELPRGKYSHVVEVLTYMIQLIKSADSLPDAEMHIVKDELPSNLDRNKITVVYEEDRQKVHVIVPQRQKIEFSVPMADLLGMLTRVHDDTRSIKSDRPARIPRRKQFPTAYVYTDIVQPVVVGDRQVQLLRTVNMDVDDGDVQMIHHVYTSPLYVPLGKKHFESIELNIMTDTGKTMPFAEGKSVAVLHFKRTTNPYFLP